MPRLYTTLHGLCTVLTKQVLYDSSTDPILSVMETLDSAELLMEDQAWLDYLWDFETRGIDLDFSSIVSSPGPDTN